MHPRLRKAGVRPGTILWAFVLVVCLVCQGTSEPSSAAVPAPAPSERPFVRMWTEVNDPGEVAALKRLSGAESSARLDELTKWYVHFHSQGANQLAMGDVSASGDPTTFAADLGARGVLASNYRNGSYVSQAKSGELTFGEAALLEVQQPLAIGTWWPGQPRAGAGAGTSTAARLTAAMGVGQTEVVVSSAGPNAPAGAPPTWPYTASRGRGLTGSTSENTHDFVSWVRVDDEIMRVRAVATSGANVALTVDRGFFGTVPAAHVQGSRVMSPVYIGSKDAAQWDTGLSGTPAVDRTGVALRYGIKVWQTAASGAKKDAVGWIASRIKATFGPNLQGHNAVWLDVTSCAQYNQADPWGNPVTPWLDHKATIADSLSYRDAQLTKIGELRRHFGPGTGWPNVSFLANNLASQGTNTTSCRNAILSQVDGGVLERWLWDRNLWTVQMEQSFQIQANDWPGIYWVKTSQADGWSTDQYERFAYGSFLLTKRDEAVRYQFGGLNAGLVRPGELYRWDLGPQKTKPARLADVQRVACTNVGSTGTTQVYSREFSKGTVLVNPTGTAVTCPFPSDVFDLVNRTAGSPTLTRSVRVGAWDAGLVMAATSTGGDGDGGGVSPGPTTVSVASPVPAQVVPLGQVDLAGTASAGPGLAEVRVAIQDTVTRTWWKANGTWGAWTRHTATLQQPGQGSTTWRFAWRPTKPGSYGAWVRAVDTLGNQSPSVWVPFEVR